MTSNDGSYYYIIQMNSFNTVAICHCFHRLPLALKTIFNPFTFGLYQDSIE